MSSFNGNDLLGALSDLDADAKNTRKVEFRASVQGELRNLTKWKEKHNYLHNIKVVHEYEQEIIDEELVELRWVDYKGVHFKRNPERALKSNTIFSHKYGDDFVERINASFPPSFTLQPPHNWARAYLFQARVLSIIKLKRQSQKQKKKVL